MKNNAKHRTVERTLSLSFAVLGMILAPIAYSKTLDSNTFETLVIPSQNPGIALGVPRIVNSNTPTIGFSATWVGTSAAEPWNGAGTGFTGTGTLPTAANAQFGSTGKYDFSNLTNNTGLLPGGTFFGFGDLDNGSGFETITFQAFDASNQLITDPWLRSPVSVYGSAATQNNMPQYKFESGIYTFQGDNVPGNPSSLNFQLVNDSTSMIRFLEVDKKTIGFGFALSAPTVQVPESGIMWLFGLGIIGLLSFGRPKRI